MLWQCVTHKHKHTHSHTQARAHTQTHTERAFQNWSLPPSNLVFVKQNQILLSSVASLKEKKVEDGFYFSWKNLWVLTQIALMEEYMLRVVYSLCSRPPELPARNPLTRQSGGVCDRRHVTDRCKRPSSAGWTVAVGGGDGHHATWTWTADRTGRRVRENHINDDRTVIFCSV